MTSRYLTITNSSSMMLGARKRTIKSQPMRIGQVTLSFVLVALICAAGVFYIFEVNNLATKGYEIKNLEASLEKIKRENDLLNIRAAELKSMYSIEERTKDLNMVVPKDISYLNLPGNMAMK